MLLGWAPPGCSSEKPPPENLRQGRFGTLRDLVLFRRPGAPFFLDRFEIAAADWQQFQADRGQPPEEEPVSLPVTNVDLWEAREFARWRFCRLPRYDEWFWAATGGGLYQFPWGDRPQISWANTVELGLGELTPAGTFESGRRSGGPYDLVGNCSEWTESVPPTWFRYERIVVQGFAAAIRRVRGSPALACWVPAMRPVPALWLVQAVSKNVPRQAAGGDFLRPLGVRLEVPGAPFVPITLLPEARLPGDRRATIGVRLAADPRGLLAALMSFEGELEPWEQELVTRFASRPEHRTVLRDAFPAALADVTAGGLEPGPVAELLAWELDL